MTSPEIIKFLSEAGRKGGTIAGEINRRKGKKYFSRIGKLGVLAKKQKHERQKNQTTP